jgi:hypothetical protein
LFDRWTVSGASTSISPSGLEAGGQQLTRMHNLEPGQEIQFRKLRGRRIAATLFSRRQGGRPA